MRRQTEDTAEPPPYDPREDELLAVRCQLGERDAFDELIHRWNGPLWQFVRRLAGRDDEARDILQDAWIRILRSIPRLRDGSRLRAWLFAITRRTVMDRLRQQYAAPAYGALDADPPAPGDAEDDLEESLEALETGLTRLPLVEREVLTLFYLRAMSLADVATVLDVPVGTVKSRLHRARLMLRRDLNSKG